MWDMNVTGKQGSTHVNILFLGLTTYITELFLSRRNNTWLKTTIAFKDKTLRGFPGGAVVENPPANAGDTGSSPGLGRSHMPRGN